MKRSLSLVLPLSNAQDTLSGQVQRLLEVLPELTPDFELVLVNDGSADQTEELAVELAREYPQVRLVNHSRPLGRQQAIESGVRAAQSGIVLVHGGESPEVSASQLMRAWRARQTLPKISVHPRPVSAALLERLRRWGQASEQVAARLAEDVATEQTVYRLDSLPPPASPAGSPPARRSSEPRSDSARPGLRNLLARLRQFAVSE